MFELIPADWKSNWDFIGTIVGIFLAIPGGIYVVLVWCRRSIRTRVTNAKWRKVRIWQLNRLSKATTANEPELRLSKLLSTTFDSGIRDIERQFDSFFGSSLLSRQSFDRCLQFAFIYPMFLFFLAWVLGGSGGIGSLAFLPNAPFTNRLIVALPLFLVLGLFILFIYKKGAEKLGQIATPRTNQNASKNPRLSGFFQNSIETSIYALLVAGAGIGAISVANIVTVNDLNTGAGTFAFAAAIAIAVAGAITFAISGIGAGIYAVGGAAFVSVTFAIVGTTYENPALFNSGLTILLFYTFLPLINAALDWLSWATTRKLLRFVKKKERTPMNPRTVIGHLFFDICAAFGFFLLLAIVIPNAIEAFNFLISAFNAKRINWLPFLEEAQENPWTSGIMVTGMLLTTLLTTIIHLGHSAAALFLACKPNKLQLINLLQELNESEGADQEFPAERATTLIQMHAIWVFSGIALAGFLLVGVWYLLGSLFGFYPGFFIDVALWGVYWWGH